MGWRAYKGPPFVRYVKHNERQMTPEEVAGHRKAARRGEVIHPPNTEEATMWLRDVDPAVALDQWGDIVDASQYGSTRR